MKKRLLLVALLIVPVACSAQDDESWQEMFQRLSDVEDVESADWEENYEWLSSLATHPIDLNQATRDDLEALPFLTAQQVEDIMAYRYRHGELQTLGELQMIRSLDYERRQLLQCFVFLGHQPAVPPLPRLDSLLRWGKHDVTASLRVPFYRREGDRNGYLGYPYKHTVRYKFHYGQRVRVGLLGAQDAGEPFFAEGNSLGYDHYAWYLMLQRLGPVEALAAGQYRLSLGMGLIMNGGFNLGKLATLQNLGRTNNAIRPNSSRMEYGYLQGGAVTLRLPTSLLPFGAGRKGTLLLTAYASCRPVDATLNADGTAATILTDGYHRTPAEMQKKHNLTQTDAGLHIDYRREALRIGATVAYTHLSRPLQPNTQTLYRRHYAQGSNFMNASIDYRYTTHRLSLSGETAIDGNGALATINALSFQPTSDFSIMALQRFYAYRYQALHARSFAEGGRVQNESGLYVGATWRPNRQLLLAAYTDVAYFAWPKYQASQSSYAWDNLLSAAYTARRWRLAGRYRLHLRQRDNAEKTQLANRMEHRGRLTLSHDTPWGVTLHTQADAAYVNNDGNDLGFMVSERMSSQLKGIKIDIGAGYFHTDSYDARLYLYERAPLYQFSFPMFYGEGLRCWLMARTDVLNRLTLTAKLGMTKYFDRSTIGTDKQMVRHSAMTDLDLQLTYKF